MISTIVLSEGIAAQKVVWRDYCQLYPLKVNLAIAPLPALPPNGQITPAVRAQLVAAASAFPAVSLVNPTQGFAWSNPGIFHGLLLYLTDGATFYAAGSFESPLELLPGDSRFISTNFI